MRFNITKFYFLFIWLNFKFCKIIGQKFDHFEAIPKTDVDNINLQSNFTLLKKESLVECLLACMSTSGCAIARFQSDECIIFKFVYFSNLVYSNQDVLFKKKYKNKNDLADGLINYWPLDGDTNDLIGNAHLYEGVNVKFTHDRFSIPNSALSFTLGYIKVPPGVYFNGNFSITTWVYVRSTRFMARFLDFGLGKRNNNVIFSLFCNSVSNIRLEIYDANNEWSGLDPPFTYPFNSWLLMTETFDGKYIRAYINGALIGIKTAFTPPNVIRTSNFIGKSNWPSDSLVDAIFDDIRIYNRCLNSDEINALFFDRF